MTAPNVALYLRVSTDAQDLDGQRRDLLAYAKQKGWAVAETYPEKVSATGKVDRIQYDRLLREAASSGRGWDHVLVWALDRFSRAETFTKATQAILDLEAQGVRFHSLKEPMLDTPDDGTPNLGRDVLLALLPVISSFESKRRSERIRVAMAEIKAGRRKPKSGRPLGRAWRLNPEKVAEISRLRSMQPPRPFSDIAQAVGLPTGTCRRVASQVKRGVDPLTSRSAHKVGNGSVGVSAPSLKTVSDPSGAVGQS